MEVNIFSAEVKMFGVEMNISEISTLGGENLDEKVSTSQEVVFFLSFEFPSFTCDARKFGTI